jgi:hypothetical protein
MKPRFFAPLFTLLFVAPAFADCTGEPCGSIQKILQARSGSFAKFKGKPATDPRGDPMWEGSQTIPGLINYCYVYRRGETTSYEYHCDSSGLGAQAPQSLEKAKQIAENLKAGFQAADPKLKWFDDPAARALADIDGFQGTEGWYGGYAPNKITAKVKVAGAGSNTGTVGFTVFAKTLARRDVK